ncbi:hypothetical protein [Croceivirga thetidis]|uniref:Uncharacterized protein n=1 Tax=Croceivirga thetidis TaxID=2721623 RepID=A0ABX1GNR8_9FLAO|nr:hypothetical protein [Croceivirga thetidis]NKI31577.1 hypothetical protein [Croceivirga thetidis]
MFLLESTRYYALREATEERCFYLDFQEKRVRLSFCQLLALRQKLNTIELDSLFYDESNPHDFKILTVCNHQHLFLVSTAELVDLKQLLQNAFISMGLSQSPISLAI